MINMRQYALREWYGKLSARNDDGATLRCFASLLFTDIEVAGGKI